MKSFPIDRDPMHLMLSRLGVGWVFTDHHGLIEALSPLAERLTGWSSPEAHGLSIDRIFRLQHKSQQGSWDPGVELDLEPEKSRGGIEESVLISRQGQLSPVEVVLAPVRDERGKIMNVVIVFRDSSHEKLAALQATRLATHDSVTGLLNRQAFVSSMEKVIAEPVQTKQSMWHCQVDIDQFNLITRSCGHSAGEDLLHWVAAILREETGPGDVVARLGGDIFALLCPRETQTEAHNLADNILRRLSAFQFTWEDKTFPLSASIGLIPIPANVRTVSEVLSAGDYACAVAKKNGGNQMCLCHLDDEELSRRQQEMEWIARIRKNLHEGGVILYGQPIRPFDDGAKGGLFFEVLLRMAGDDGEARSAGNVIQAAERYGLMATIDHWVIRNTLQILKGMSRSAMARLRLCSINLSSVSLYDKSILDFIHEQLARTKVPPPLVCFEITETAAVENLSQTRWLISALQSIGCRFALDDFGSGLASYSHLKDLPVDFLKIAGSFVENITSSTLDRAMVESITQISRVLGIATIAEAVSGQEAYDLLQKMGVTYAQGNWVGAPVPLRDLIGS